ncbi:MAG: Gfo/Idh/MocA family protein, partial [Terriglobia bacterium]
MVKLGIAGMGYIGRVHYEASRKISNGRVVAVATSRPGEARAFLPPEVCIFEDYERLLQDSGVDAVIIAAPTSLHERYTTQAAECGKHILCEKPLALNEAAARRILAAAERAGITLMAAQVLRFWPQYARIKQLVAEGAIGAIRAVDAWRLASYPPWGGWFRDP